MFLHSVGAGLAAAIVAAPPTTARSAPLPAPNRIPADPALLSASDAAALLQAKRLHPRELLEACLHRSARFDGPINSWVRTYPELAYEQAEQAGRRLAAGDAPLLCGLPIALKDLIAVAGLPVTACSRVLAGNIAAGDATAWQRLRDQGAVLVGHAQNDEFGFGGICAQTGNPWDTTASVGGSSGGNAAVLAARFAPLAVGTDTGGSLRIPSSRSGVSAIKPTYGQVSRHGVVPTVPSRDHIGPMARSIADAALLLSALTGTDPNDPATATASAVPQGGYPLTATGGTTPLAGQVFGVDRKTMDQLPAALGVLMSGFLDLVVRLGGRLRDITMPELPGTLLDDSVEIGRYHHQWIDRLGLYQPASAAMVTSGLAALAAPIEIYLTFERERLRYQHNYNRLLIENDLAAVILPTVTNDRQERRNTPPDPLDTSPPTIGANYCGAPVVALPIGRSAATGLPFGVQISGRPWSEPELIRIGLELQAAEPVWEEMPDLPDGTRELPDTARSAPGRGPDPTGTIVVPPPFRFVPTTATS
ncbi:amidase [Nocardia flavorosea]|uniref:amidase n=1 Tax=Nocardia flavorosea TaxID=53429 RepID=UPI001894BE13|nr:amidase [Nocardia flavorosea]MBF6352558.1 amidase [Nocardia flavorosea]